MKKHFSFTLIELLVVIFIIILLIGITIVTFQRGNWQLKQNDNQRKKDTESLGAAIEAFKADRGHYPFVNWGLGIHAQKFLDGVDDPLCLAGSYGSNYMPSKVGVAADFTPGGEIRFKANGEACDDLSLQLLGRAYLPRMPKSVTINPDDITGINLWQPGPFKSYIDEIPKEPTYDPVTGRGANVGINYKTSDYDPTSPQYFRYLYISYYDCPSEGISVGDRYWLNAIVGLKDNGEEDDIAGGQPATHAFFYEWGTANWFRHPRSLCR